MKKKTLDLRKAYQLYDRENTHKEQNTIYYVIILVAVLLVGAYGYSLMLKNQLAQVQINELETYVNDEERQKQLQEVTETQTLISGVSGLESNVKSIASVFALKTKLPESVIKDLLESIPQGGSLSSLTLNGTQLTITIIQPDSTTDAYATRLQTSANFKDVSFQNSVYDASKGSYTVTYTAVLGGLY